LPESARSIDAEATSFGDDPTTVSLQVLPRSTRWRAARAAPLLAGGLVLAPVAFILPPHVPWALGVAGTGAFLAHRKWRERRTLTGLDGPCPHCGTALTLAGDTALRSPHTHDCDACHHHVTLHWSDDD
jgi:hypothetical protein